jgi:hypothetical protein
MAIPAITATTASKTVYKNMGSPPGMESWDKDKPLGVTMALQRYYTVKNGRVTLP